MVRGGKNKDEQVAERRCIVSGKSSDRSGLIRFVLSPDQTVTPDLSEKLPGRGMWVTADRAALEKAVSRNLFSKAAKAQAKIPDGLVDLIESLLVRKIGDTLSLARKSGRAVAGKDKVKALLEDEEVSILFQASDGSEREKRGLRPPKGKDRHFEVLTAWELGMAFGRERVIHAALIAGGLDDSIRYESSRLRGLRSA